MLTFFRVCRRQSLAPQRSIWVNVGSAVAGCTQSQILKADQTTHTQKHPLSLQDVLQAHSMPFRMCTWGNAWTLV